MARIPYYDLGKASPVVADAMKNRRPLNIYRMLAHGEETAVNFLALGRSILTMSEIDAKLRELVILRVGALCGSTYEMIQHRSVAAKVGVSAEKIEAVLADPGSDVHAELFNDMEQAVLRFTDSVVREVKAPEPLFRGVATELPHRQLIELLMTIGFYMLASRISENLEVDIEEAEQAR